MRRLFGRGCKGIKGIHCEAFVWKGVQRNQRNPTRFSAEPPRGGFEGPEGGGDKHQDTIQVT